MEGDLTSGGEHRIQYTHGVIIELYTPNLYNFINQCHPNKFNEKEKKNNDIKCSFLLLFYLYLFLIYFIDYAVTVVPFISPLYSPQPCTPLPPAFPPLSSCPWVVHVSSLASPFPILFLTSPCLFCTYHLCMLSMNLLFTSCWVLDSIGFH